MCIRNADHIAELTQTKFNAATIESMVNKERKITYKEPAETVPFAYENSNKQKEKILDELEH